MVGIATESGLGLGNSSLQTRGGNGLIVREGLGVSLQDITRVGGTPAWRYEITQPLGKLAQSRGFNGILAPSAQADGGVNLILFGSKGVK